MKAEILCLDELSKRQLAAWSELGARAIAPNPFAEPDFVLPAARGLRAADIGVLAVHGRDGWLAAAPVRRQRSWYRVPGRCLTVWSHPYGFLGTPLVTGDDPAAALSAMARRALRDRRSFIIDRLDADGPLAAPIATTLDSHGAVVVLREFERPVIRRSAAPLQATPSPKHRNQHAKSLRRLEQQLGTLAITDRSDDPAAYDQFLALEQAGWKGAAGTAIACDAGHAEFFREMCTRFARAGKLQLLSLEGPQRPVAMMCSLLAGDAGFGFKMAYDETYRKYEPGRHLLSAFADWFQQSAISWYDFCSEPDNATMNRMWLGRRRLSSIVAIRRGPGVALTHLKWQLAASAVPVRRAMRERWGWARRTL